MAQWVNRLRNNIFVNPPLLSLSCEISGALHLAQLDLMAGWQADEIQVNFEIFKIDCRLKYSSFRFNIQHHYSLTNAFQRIFWIKPIARLILKCKISGSHTISDQSLLYRI